MRKLRDGSGGFTLIELLVVVAIIGLITSLALVALQNARNKARYGQMMSQMKVIVTAAEAYKADTGWSASSTATGTAPAFVPTWLPIWPDTPCKDPSQYLYDWDCVNCKQTNEYKRVELVRLGAALYTYCIDNPSCGGGGTIVNNLPAGQLNCQ